MSTTVDPIYVGDLLWSRLRMFRSPQPIPDLPWVCIPDLLIALKLTRQQRRALERKISEKFKSDIVVANTMEGQVEVGPHALGLFAIEIGVTNAARQSSFLTAFAEIGVNAMKQITTMLSPQMTVEFTLAAKAIHDRRIASRR